MAKKRETVFTANDRQKLRRKFFKRYPDKDGFYTCWLCKQPVAKDKVSLDHVLSVEDYPEYAKEVSNVRPSHVFCNQERAHSVLKDLRAKKIIKTLD